MAYSGEDGMCADEKRVDYDQVSNCYNLRYKHSPMTGTRDALRRLAEECEATTVLEVGCGTGHWLQQLACPGRQVLGLDSSRGMLLKAHQAGEERLQQGTAQCLPYRSSCLDLVFVVNALHHFHEPDRFLHAAFRVLKPGGMLALIGSDPGDPRYCWYVYDWFPGVLAFDLERFPGRGELLVWGSDAGFENLQSSGVELIENSLVGRSVLDDPFLEKFAVSQLALISDNAYQSGLASIRDALVNAERNGENLIFKTVIPVEMITARKPASE
jgi:SAM-dependent methyltransferase